MSKNVYFVKEKLSNAWSFNFKCFLYSNRPKKKIEVLCQKTLGVWCVSTILHKCKLNKREELPSYCWLGSIGQCKASKRHTLIPSFCTCCVPERSVNVQIIEGHVLRKKCIVKYIWGGVQCRIWFHCKKVINVEFPIALMTKLISCGK